MKNTLLRPLLSCIALALCLGQPAVLRAETERLLADPRSARFVDTFTDYWLDLRKTMGTAPDSALYDDYYLDDLLTESALAETQTFFGELVRADLPGQEHGRREEESCRRILAQRVADNLLADEAVEGFVIVKRGHEVVAIPPRMVARQIVTTSMRLREMNRIQPVPRHVLPRR